jgi:hypothetical protein
MSAFIVTHKTIDAVISAILAANNQYGERWPLEVGPLSVSRRDLTKLGQALLDMNIAAVDCRYREKNDAEVYQYRPTHFERIVALKQLHCFLYQCSEGDVPELPLFKAVEAFGERLARQIITGNPAYNSAPWGMGERSKSDPILLSMM